MAVTALQHLLGTLSGSGRGGSSGEARARGGHESGQGLAASHAAAHAGLGARAAGPVLPGAAGRAGAAEGLLGHAQHSFCVGAGAAEPHAGFVRVL